VKEKQSIRLDYEARLKEAEKYKQEQMKQKKKVLLANQDIKAGEKLTPELFTIGELPVDQVPENVIVDSEDLKGKITKIDISKNGMVLPSMLFDEGITPRDVRNAEYTMISLPTKLKKDDFIDVRINFPTGQDYIVLAKKKVKDLQNGTVWLDVNEQEILTMSSAIVDAFINDAKIYALAYVDPYMQEKPVINYPVNLKVLSLILTDPNLLRIAESELSRNARMVLEKDLAEMSAEAKQKIASARAAADQRSESNNQQPASNEMITEPTVSPPTTNQNQTIPQQPAENKPQEGTTPLPNGPSVVPSGDAPAGKKEEEIYRQSVSDSVSPEGE
jgi:hypothetical protein